MNQIKKAKKEFESAKITIYLTLLEKITDHGGVFVTEEKKENAYWEKQLGGGLCIQNSK